MRRRIRELQAAARRLEPAAPERAELREAAGHYAERWLASLPGLPGYVPDDAAAVDALAALPIGEEPTSLDAVLAGLAAGVDRLGVNEPAGHFFGFIPSGGSHVSAVADYLAAVTNRYSGVRYGAPGAARVDDAVLSWLCELFGYPLDAGGDLTSGGSVATLSAVVSAREGAGVAARDVARTAVYLTEHTHHAVAKALRIAGLSECVVRRVPLDDRFRIDAGALDRQAGADAAAGLRPWLVVASAGTTDTGAVDPLEAVADVAASHGMWLHTDAAYGGAFMLTADGRQRLAGIERSDSLVFDPHKGLFVPFGTGVVLVRDRDAMRRAHGYSAAYLRDTGAEELSPADLSPELTRPFRGLRVWLPLQLNGVAAYRAALEEKLLLARFFHQRMQQMRQFEVGPEPDLSVVVFRLAGEGPAADEANTRLALAIQRDGRIYLSSTTIGGRVMLRLAILGQRTHLEHVDLAVEVIGELGVAVSRASRGAEPQPPGPT